MIARRHCLLALGAALAGCASAPEPTAGAELEASPPWPPEFVEQAPRGAGRLLRLQPERSRLRVYVFRAGSLARLGHNHVIAVPRFEGWLWWPDLIEGPGALAAARAALRLRWEDIELDAPAERAAAGSAFASPLDAAAVAATRANLLGPRGVDAQRHPVLRLDLLALRGEPPRLAARVRWQRGEHQHESDVALRLSGEPGAPRLAGALVLRHSALGLQPFALPGGLLAVQDEVLLEFELQAGV
ncbi:UNVERIFIED_ORG: hypothetical protein LHJ69_19785 [Shinella sp. XGS7]|nr:hypothetical protein [Shinella sp. XGS7]